MKKEWSDGIEHWLNTTRVKKVQTCPHNNVHSFANEREELLDWWRFSICVCRKEFGMRSITELIGEERKPTLGCSTKCPCLEYDIDEVTKRAKKLIGK